MNAVMFLVVFLIAGVFFGWLEGDADPAAMVGHEFTWIDWMFLIAISSIGGPTLVIVFARVITWLLRRDDEARNAYYTRWTDEAARSVRVAQGIDPPGPEDLAKIEAKGAAGPWMEGMPEEVHLDMEGRHREPVHYKRADVVERIERRRQSSPGYYWVGAGEVPRELFTMAELVCGGARPTVDWFHRFDADLKTSPIEFVNQGGDLQVVEDLLVRMTGQKVAQ